MSRKNSSINDKLKELDENGFTIIKRVLNHSEVKSLLCSRCPTFSRKYKSVNEENSTKHLCDSLRSSNKRKRSGLQEWKGIIDTINDHIRCNGDELVAPLTARSEGRFDLPLPRSHYIYDSMTEILRISGVYEILETYVKSGKIKTQNVLLSKKGSTRQPIHSDHHKKGYLTALIPLVKQTKEIGGTRLYPGSHKKRKFDPEKSVFVDCVFPLIDVGDCVIFDGLLMHCGMENLSRVDRYFYYASFCKGHDYNTDATAI